MFRHFYLTIKNDCIGRGRWDLLGEDIMDLLYYLIRVRS